MARLKPNTVRDTGAQSGDVLVGNLQTNNGMRIRIDQDQLSRQAQSQPNSKLVGTFTLLDAGQGTYVSLLQPFVGRQWTAAKLVQAMRKIDPTLNPWKTFASENLHIETAVKKYAQPRPARNHSNSPNRDDPQTGGSPPIAFENESLGDLQTGADVAVPTREKSLGDLETGLDADLSLSDLDDLVGEFECTTESNDRETR